MKIIRKPNLMAVTLVWVLRLYGPTQAFFDKQWKPDDIVKVK